MIVIRLSRTGRKKLPVYHVVVADSRSPRDGRRIEQIGCYKPLARGKEACLELNVERHDYWLSKGAQPSDRVKYLYKNLDKLTSATNPTRAQAKKEQASASSKAKPAAKIDEKTEETEA